jgi:hypothetical protein
MSRYVPTHAAHADVNAASPYAYRLPPDTFLSRRDPNFYIGAVNLSPQFKEQLELARSALRELRIIGNTIQRASTDPGTAEAGRMAATFAAETGPRLVSEAESGGDVAKLARVQGSVQRMIAFLKPDVVPAVISRFALVALVGPAGAIVSADTLNKAKEAGMEAADKTIEAGKEAIKTAVRGTVRLGQEAVEAGLEEAGKKPFSTALLVGGVVGILALYFVIKKG